MIERQWRFQLQQQVLGTWPYSYFGSNKEQAESVTRTHRSSYCMTEPLTKPPQSTLLCCGWCAPSPFVLDREEWPKVVALLGLVPG